MTKFERNREANALSAISRELAATAAAAEHTISEAAADSETKRLRQSGSPPADEKSKAAAEDKKGKQKKEKRPTRTGKRARGDLEIAAADSVAAPRGANIELDSSAELQAKSPTQEPAAAQDGPATGAFQQWYLSTMANCFAEEIEALHEADGAVPAAVLVRALGSGALLFSPSEQRLALAPASAPG